MTKHQINLALLIVARLNPDDPGFTGSDEVRAALLNPDLRVYLDTWVVPKADMLLRGGVCGGRWVDSTRRDADYVRACRRQADTKARIEGMPK